MTPLKNEVVRLTAENTGNTIITDMENQKELLTDARTKVKETKDFTTEARRVLRSMGNRAILHKLCVMFTILVLAGIIASLPLTKTMIIPTYFLALGKQESELPT